MKTLKILILFVIVLSGCSKDYLVGTREELADRESFSLRKGLDIKVVSWDGRCLSLGVQVKKFVVVADSLRIEKFYRRGTKNIGTVQVLLGCVVGLGGFVLGSNYAKSDGLLKDESGKISRGRIISCVSCLLGLALFNEGISQEPELVKVVPGSVKVDTLYDDSAFLFEQKIKVGIEDSDFEKVYYTDDSGIIDVRVDEILAEPKKIDSMINVIIRYHELADTINLKLLKDL